MFLGSSSALFASLVSNRAPTRKHVAAARDEVAKGKTRVESAVFFAPIRSQVSAYCARNLRHLTSWFQNSSVVIISFSSSQNKNSTRSILNTSGMNQNIHVISFRRPASISERNVLAKTVPLRVLSFLTNQVSGFGSLGTVQNIRRLPICPKKTPLVIHFVVSPKLTKNSTRSILNSSKMNRRPLGCRFRGLLRPLLQKKKKMDMPQERNVLAKIVPAGRFPGFCDNHGTKHGSMNHRRRRRSECKTRKSACLRGCGSAFSHERHLKAPPTSKRNKQGTDGIET